MVHLIFEVKIFSEIFLIRGIPDSSEIAFVLLRKIIEYTTT